MSEHNGNPGSGNRLEGRSNMKFGTRNTKIRFK
jgi:hypothetical protein